MTEEKPGHLTAFLRERQAYMLGATLVRKTFRKVHKVVQVSSFQCLLKAKTGSWGRQTPSNAPTVWPNISLSGKTSKCSRGKKKKTAHFWWFPLLFSKEAKDRLMRMEVCVWGTVTAFAVWTTPNSSLVPCRHFCLAVSSWHSDGKRNVSRCTY